jgi:hypothetical protein
MATVRKGKKKVRHHKYDMQTTLIGRKELEASKEALQLLRALPRQNKQ